MRANSDTVFPVPRYIILVQYSTAHSSTVQYSTAHSSTVYSSIQQLSSVGILYI